MQIRRIKNDSGEFHCFELENSDVSRQGAADTASRVPGVEMVTLPKLWHEEVFCEFILNGHLFKIAEPYGDNTTYDVIAPKPDLIELETIAAHFEMSAPIKGGDIGRNVYGLVRIGIGGAIFSLVVCLVLRA